MPQAQAAEVGKGFLKLARRVRALSADRSAAARRQATVDTSARPAARA